MRDPYEKLKCVPFSANSVDTKDYVVYKRHVSCIQL